MEMSSMPCGNADWGTCSHFYSVDLRTTPGCPWSKWLDQLRNIPPVQLETSGCVLSTMDMVVQRRDGPRWLRDNDDDDDELCVCVPAIREWEEAVWRLESWAALHVRRQPDIWPHRAVRRRFVWALTLVPVIVIDYGTTWFLISYP